MNATPELVELIQRDRARTLERDRLVRLAARARACGSPSTLDRLARALRLAPTRC